MTTLTPDNLIKAGYKKSSNFGPLSNADFLFQKRVRDAHGRTLYFVNIYQFVGLYKEHAAHRDIHGWQPEIQFNLPDSKSLNMTLLSFTLLEEIEDFFDMAFRRLECLPDD